MIYTVTTVPYNFPHKNATTVGFFNTYEDAQDCVKNNDCDIAEEGWYRFAIIEEYTPGIYMVPQYERWFEWDGDSKVYKPRLERPKKFRNICCWGMS